MLAKLTNYSNMDKNSKILLIIIGVIVFLLVLLFIVNHFSNRKEKKQARIRKAHNKKLQREIEAESKHIEPITKVSKVTVSTEAQNIKPIEKEVEIEKINDEPIEVEDEMIEILQEEQESDVDRILREIKNATQEDSLNLTEFEREQEETAIISYDELCKKAGVKKKVYNEKPVQEVKPKKELYKGGYKPSKFVSPIFGVQDEKKDYSKNEEDLNQTFLKNLKEFRSGLE